MCVWALKYQWKKIMNFALNFPINSVSFGQVSFNLLREVYARQVAPCIFPIGNADISAQKTDPEMNFWLQSCINKSNKYHRRDNPVIKLWHIFDSMSSFSKEQILITFLETDTVTDMEANILANQKHVFVTNNYTKSILEEVGLSNLSYLELGFDYNNFYKLNKKYYEEDIVVWGLFGKMENRKHTLKALRAWIEVFGNNSKHRLHCSIFNPFLTPEEQKGILAQVLDKEYFNVNFLPSVRTNAEYNDIINSVNIVMALSGGEGFDIPVFHSVGLGKHCIGLRAHAYLDYLNDENAVLVKPNGKTKAHDGKFFIEGQPYNQGNFFTWDMNEVKDAFNLVLQKYQKNPINEEGLKLQKRSYKNTLDKILEKL